MGAYDKNGSGKIEADELCSTIPPKYQEYCNKLVSFVDCNNDGAIDKAELHAAVMEYPCGPPGGTYEGKGTHCKA